MVSRSSILITLSVLAFGFVYSIPAELGLYSAFENSLEQINLKRENNFREKKLDISAPSFKTESRKQKEKAKTNTTTAGSGGSVLSSGPALYRLNAEGGGTCILLQVDALLEFNFSSVLVEKKETKDFFVPPPPEAQISGDCSDEDKQKLVIKGKAFVLYVFFSKTPGGERWFISRMELKYDTSDHIFEHIKNKKPYLLSTSSGHGQLLFPTPVGKSYYCDKEISVEFTSLDTDTKATILLRDLKLEPFIFKNDEFGPEYKCSGSGIGSYRSETAPLVVGSLLAAACLITIIGYSVYRYFNIEKVQYDTME